MNKLPFKQVDVFTNTPFKGNPVAVILDGASLSSTQMQQIADWTNLSETTFVIPATNPEAHYQVRIFTPVAELPFAGHPTIGTAHALMEAGLIAADGDTLIQQCGAGLVRLRLTSGHDGTRLMSFELPEPSFTPLDAAQVSELEGLLGTPLLQQFAPCVVDVGPRWVVAQLPGAGAVLDAQPDLQRMKEQDLEAGYTGVVIFGEYADGGAARIEVRAFAPAYGVNEDPVCGSGTGCVGAFIRHTGQLEHFGTTFLASQGARVGRAGQLLLDLGGTAVQVGGNAVTCIDGEISV
jgi:PhzF family phenazine biosynthesis protein